MRVRASVRVTDRTRVRVSGRVRDSTSASSSSGRVVALGLRLGLGKRSSIIHNWIMVRVVVRTSVIFTVSVKVRAALGCVFG